MTNEELAIQIQQGDASVLPQLWEQNKGLVFMLSRSHYIKKLERCEACGVTMEDILQESYFAMLDAAKAFEPAKGFKLSAYLRFTMKNRVNAMLGWRSSRVKNDPLNLAGSLDEPLPGLDDSNITQGDAIPDKTAGTAFESVEDDAFNQQLHDALDRSLSTLPENQQEVIRARYYGGLKLRELAEQKERSIELMRQLESAGLRGLRKPQSTRFLKDFQEEIISRAYSGTGYSAFYNSQASVEERVTEYIDERQRQYEQLKEQIQRETAEDEEKFRLLHLNGKGNL